MRTAEDLLDSLEADAGSIRLDCTAQQVRALLPRLAVCGVHPATRSETAELGYLEGTLVPDPPLPLGPGHAGPVLRFLADPGTPAGLCLAFGSMALTQSALPRILDEAADPDFQPLHGSDHRLGPFRGRLVDVLTARPGARTTTLFDPRISLYSEQHRAVRVGLHYDNTLVEGCRGERFSCTHRVALADRRVLLNTGPGPRRFLAALNTTALHLSEKACPGDRDNIPNSRQLRQFLRDHPAEVDSIVCLVIRLDPGDYVLFPAGVALHDGSMYGLPEKSVAVVLSGRFPRSAASRRPARRAAA